MKIQAPIEVEIKVSVTNGEGVSGVATLGLGRGHYPSEEKMREAIADFVKTSMPDGFRLMTKREWWNSIIPPQYEEDEDGERYPIHVAMPGGEEYED